MGIGESSPQSAHFGAARLIYRAGTGSTIRKTTDLARSVLVPTSLLSGNGFPVDEQVPTDGLMAHFTIRSDVGIFPANSIEMLKTRVAEIRRLSS
jgi:hypothetical protein